MSNAGELGTDVVATRSASSYLSHFSELEIHPMAGPKVEGHYALECSIEHDNSRARAWCQVLDCLDGACLFSESLALESRDPIDTHDRLGRLIAAAFGDRLVVRPPAGNRMSRKSALRYNLAAREAIFRNSEPDLIDAQVLSRKAVEVEPTFAFGYIGLAFVNSLYFANSWGNIPRDEALRRAVDHAERALELEPFNYAVQFCRGMVHRFEGMLDRAIFRYNRALELNPCTMRVRNALGNALLFSGDANAALLVEEETYAMVPNKAEWTYGSMALALWANDRVDEALDMAQKKVLTTADLVSLTVYQVETGSLSEARRTMSKILSVAPDWRISTNYICNTFQDQALRKRYTNALRIAGAPD